jgi:hypothetical protein
MREWVAVMHSEAPARQLLFGPYRVSNSMHGWVFVRT